MWLLPKRTHEYDQMLEDADVHYKKKRFNPKSAVTNYRVLDTSSQTALVLCQPETGDDDVRARCRAAASCVTHVSKADSFTVELSSCDGQLNVMCPHCCHERYSTSLH